MIDVNRMVGPSQWKFMLVTALVCAVVAYVVRRDRSAHTYALESAIMGAIGGVILGGLLFAICDYWWRVGAGLTH